VAPPKGQAELISDLILTFFVAELVEHAEIDRKRARKLDEWQLTRLHQYIEDSLGARASRSTKALATLFSMGTRALASRFKNATGENLHAYIRRIRNEQAKAMLIRESTSIKDIATRLGFTSESYFSAEFRRANGCTPSLYRNRRLVDASIPPVGEKAKVFDRDDEPRSRLRKKNRTCPKRIFTDRVR
jgi:AraC family transcriptional regulator